MGMYSKSLGRMDYSNSIRMKMILPRKSPICRPLLIDNDRNKNIIR